MHPNSLTAWAQLLANEKVTQREWEVFKWVWNNPGHTDHDCRDGLNYAERNDVSPAITRLKQAGYVVEGDPVVGPDTGYMRRTLYVAGTAPEMRQGGLF